MNLEEDEMLQVLLNEELVLARMTLLLGGVQAADFPRKKLSMTRC
jgi:hypothetical protein